MSAHDDNTNKLRIRASDLIRAGRASEAIAVCEQILHIAPNDAVTMNTLGVSLAMTGRKDDAISAFRAAVKLRPEDIEALLNLARLLQASQRRDEAIAAFLTATKLNPNRADVLIPLGELLIAAQRFPEAVPVLEVAAKLTNQATIYSNLGGALRMCNRLGDAIDAYQSAVRIKPDFAHAHANLGKALLEVGRAEEAVEAHRRAIELHPKDADFYAFLGLALSDLSRYPESLAAFETALKLNPGNAVALDHLAATLRAMGRVGDAIQAHEAAITREPRNTGFHWNFALTLLGAGDWTRGFSEYEWRLQSRMFDNGFRTEKPQWRGEPIAGRTIFIHAEQGLGDSIQFIRYAKLVSDRGARVIARCQKPLLRLFKSVAGVDEWTQDDPREFDCHCRLLSLPAVFGTTPESVPRSTPYLHAPAALVAQRRAVMSEIEGFRVGLAWRGNQDNARMIGRSMTAQTLSPLARIQGVRFVSLQKFAPNAAKVLPPGMDLLDWSDELSDFADTAALMMNLDLVISVDTSVAHLAGALGVPTWVMVGSVPDWRWMHHREDSPWYPTMRLFRQSQQGNWDEVIARVGAALEGEIARVKAQRR